MNISNPPAIAITFRCNCSQPLHARTIGFLADWISAYVFIKGNKERLVLYFLVSFLGTFLTIFLVLSIRLYVQKRRAIRLLKETAPLVSPISDISYEAHRDTTLDPLDISVPTSQTTLNHGPNNGHHQHHHLHHSHAHHPHRFPHPLTTTLTSVGGGGHTQTHLDSQYQPLLVSPRHHSHSQSQSPQQSSRQDSSTLNNSSSNQANTSNNSSNATRNADSNNSPNNNLIVNSNITNSLVNSNDNDNLTPPIDDARLYATVPSSSQRRSTRESSSPRTITTISSDNSPRATLGSINNPRSSSRPPNEIIIGYS